MNPFWAGNPAAIGQQTRAGQLIVASAPGNGMRRAPKRKRKASRKTAARKRRASPAKRSRPARLVKGSAAARAYMAKIRRKRRK